MHANRSSIIHYTDSLVFSLYFTEAEMAEETSESESEEGSSYEETDDEGSGER